MPLQSLSSWWGACGTYDLLSHFALGMPGVLAESKAQAPPRPLSSIETWFVFNFALKRCRLVDSYWGS